MAHEVELLTRRGHRQFVIRRIDHGGMLDKERMGAAHYAAGIQSEVVLEEEIPTAVAAAR